MYMSSQSFFRVTKTAKSQIAKVYKNVEEPPTTADDTPSRGFRSLSIERHIHIAFRSICVDDIFCYQLSTHVG